MISKVLNRDVFTEIRQPGEEKIRIVCGTNNLGDNSTAPGSVAGQIGKIDERFMHLPDGAKSMGEIHKVKGELHDDSAHFIGIVCNEVQGLITDPERIWKFAPAALREGFETIYKDDTIIPSRQNKHKMGMGVIQQIQQSIDYTLDSNDVKVKEILEKIEKYQNQMNPILRTVMVGAGRSGVENDADVAEILRVMQDSKNNLHLYVQKEMVHQVANVVQLFPELQSGALLDYSEIRLTA